MLPLPASLFESAFNQAAVGEYLLSPSDDPVILAVNDAFLRAAGRTREQLLGQRLFVAFAADPTDGGDTGVAALRGSLARVLATGRADTLPVQRYPIPLQQSDGSEAFEERFWNATSTPIYDAGGALVCIAHRTEDVTASARLNAALRESQRAVEAERSRLQTIIDTIPTGLIMLDEAGAMVLENAEWKRTWAGNARLNSVVDYDSYKGFRPETGERISAEEWPCAVSLKQGLRTRDVILDIERFNGTRGTIVVSSAPLRDDTGRVIGAVAANMDISELRAAQARLQEADRRKDEFLATLAHELRNPLAPIRTGLELLAAGAPAPVAERAVGVMRRQVGHMVRLIDDLLDVSRITRGRLDLVRERVSLGRIVEAAVEANRPLIERARQTLRVLVDPAPAELDADLTRCAQVVGNLLNNASKYTPAGGTLTLSARADGGDAVIAVTDDGVGIPADRLGEVFEMFSQVNRALERSQGGLGIGLALVRRLVEMHGGTVTAASEGTNRGATFTVRLPRLVDATGAVGPDSIPAGLAPARRRMLVVDDNQDAAELLALMLTQAGHAVVTAHDGPSALALAREAPPEVVFLDIGMPRMNGYEVARAMRVDPRLAPAALVAVTGWGTSEDKRKATEAGFDVHLTKPVAAHDVHEALARVAPSRPAAG